MQSLPAAPDDDRQEERRARMGKSKNELLIQVVERYLFHKNFATENPFVAEIAQKMCEIDVDEMWMLTQQ